MSDSDCSSVRSTCPYCGVGCGVVATPVADADAQPSYQISGDPHHPANFGNLCAKGRSLGATLSHQGRLLTPKINGRAESWPRAIAHVASRFSQAIAEHGPDSVAFYLSGQLLTEDYYVANKLMKGFIGSANVDTNSRLCMSSAVVAHKKAFGADLVPGCYEDFELADLVVLVGSNLAWCHPVLFQRLMAAKAKRPKLKLVVIDPRQTATSEAADLHLQLKPDSDLVLFNGLLKQLQQQGLAQLVSPLLEYSLGQVAEQTGLKPADIATFYRWFAECERTVSGFSMGSNQSVNGVANANAIINCHIVTGRIGKPGAGPFSITGQPNAMGGREVGGLATALAAHIDFAETDKAAQLQQLWQAPTMAGTTGLTAVPMFEAMAAGKIKAVWIIGTNPAVSLPDSDLVRRALKRCPTVVVSDVVASNDTMALADVLLPAKAWGEKSGTVTNAERRISRQRGFATAPALAKADWQIVCEVAKAMGFAEGFNYADAAAIFREHASSSAINGGEFDISALATLTDNQYQQLPPLQWPQPKGKPLQLLSQRLTIANPKLQLQRPQRRRGKGRFVLNSGRYRDQWHSMTRTGSVDKLSGHRPYPQLHVHPDDAAELGLAVDGLVELEGQCWPLLLDSDLRRGDLFAALHFNRHNCSVGSVNHAVDRWQSSQLDGDSQQPAFKAARVDIKGYRAKAPLWWGQLLLPNGVEPPLQHLTFWAAQRLQQGTLWWFADDRDSGAWQQWLVSKADKLGRLHSELGGSGSYGAVYQRDGHLSAALRLAQSRQQLAGDGWQQALGQPLAAPLVNALLGGDHRQLLCSCVGVSQAEVEQAIAAGAATPAAVQQACGAGGGCGVCQMEISGLCRQQQSELTVAS